MLFGCFWLCGLASIPWWVMEEFDAMQVIALRPAAFSTESSSIPVLVFIPFMLTAVWAVYKRCKGNYTDKDANRLLTVAIINAPIFFISLIFTHWIYAKHMADQGYQSCKLLSGAALHDPNIWVRSSEYYLHNRSTVSRDLLVWAKDQAEQGIQISVVAFQKKADELLLIKQQQ